MKRIKHALTTLGSSIRISAWFVGLLWCLLIIDGLLDLGLARFGVYPRSEAGVLGILTAPLVHGSVQHLAANSLPVLVLGSILLFGYPKSRWWALGIIWFTGGVGVWLFGRQSFHIGASGVAHGLFFYLLVISILRRDTRSIALMMLAFFLFGGMLLTILPREPGVSFESHLFGAIGGTVAAVLFRNWDPKPFRKRYDWETDEGARDGILSDEVPPNPFEPPNDRQP